MALVTWPCSEGSGTTVGDTETDPLDGSFVNSPTWGSNAAGNSVIVATGGNARVNSAVIDGTKVDTALHGTKTCTLELNCEFNSSTGNSPNFGIDDATNARALYLRLLDDQLRKHINGTLVSLATISGSGDDVFHCATDTAQSTQTDRCKFYQGGSQLTTVSGPALDTTFDLSSTSIFLTFHSDAGGSQDVYFTSLHVETLDGTTIADRAAALAADNDTDPGGEPPPPANAPKGWFDPEFS